MHQYPFAFLASDQDKKANPIEEEEQYIFEPFDRACQWVHNAVKRVLLDNKQQYLTEKRQADLFRNKVQVRDGGPIWQLFWN